MLNGSQRYGKKSEQLAAGYLKKQGYTIICRNFRAPCGEIDIIARDGPALVFVEVKARRNHRYGGAKASITRAKMSKITQTALYYLKKTRQTDQKVRFDVVFIENEVADLYKNAFDAVLPS